MLFWSKYGLDTRGGGCLRGTCFKKNPTSSVLHRRKNIPFMPVLNLKLEAKKKTATNISSNRPSNSEISVWLDILDTHRKSRKSISLEDDIKKRMGNNRVCLDKGSDAMC